MSNNAPTERHRKAKKQKPVILAALVKQFPLYLADFLITTVVYFEAVKLLLSRFSVKDNFRYIISNYKIHLFWHPFGPIGRSVVRRSFSFGLAAIFRPKMARVAQFLLRNSRTQSLLYIFAWSEIFT